MLITQSIPTCIFCAACVFKSAAARAAVNYGMIVSGKMGLTRRAFEESVLAESCTLRGLL